MGHQPYFLQHAMKSAQSCKHLCLDRRQTTRECLNLMLDFHWFHTDRISIQQLTAFSAASSEKDSLKTSICNTAQCKPAVRQSLPAIQSHSLSEGMLIDGIN